MATQIYILSPFENRKDSVLRGGGQYFLLKSNDIFRH